jgi:ATP-binding cassette subfamily B protein RaxB
LPIAWFERRHIGDVLSRFQSINPIRQFMTEGAIGSVLDGMLALATLAVMLFYSVKLTFVALAAFALYGLVRLASFSAQRSAQEEAIAATGQEQSVMIETLRGIVTLRLYNKEAARSAFWQARLTEALNANVGLARITAWQGASNVLIMGVETILSTWLAVRLVIDGGFSIGMVFAFLAYKTQFLQKASSLTDQLIGFRMLRLHLERLSDIALAPPDPSFNDQALVRRELKGRLELREIRFRYGPSDAWTLDGVNLLVEPGENIVISGPSGGGKSTLLKIILGLIEPDEGEVLVDGIPLVRFGHKHFHDQVGAVLQDDSLFAGSLMNNIALFDDEPDQIRAYDVARMASVHDDIATMPMRYETLVGDMGSTLSGGQRQRLLLARALYRRPRMLIIDEGTSHLDPAREQSVNSAIGSLGITRISVAHRLETVLSGDRQYSLRDGTLVEITGQMHALTHN